MAICTVDPALRTAYDSWHVSEMDEAQVNLFFTFAKLSVWHSGSPLWAHINELEQLITLALDTWLPMNLFLFGLAVYLSKTGQMSVAVGVVIGLVGVLAWWHAFTRKKAQLKESREVVMSYFIVTRDDK